MAPLQLPLDRRRISMTAVAEETIRDMMDLRPKSWRDELAYVVGFSFWDLDGAWLERDPHRFLYWVTVRQEFRPERLLPPTRVTVTTVDGRDLVVAHGEGGRCPFCYFNLSDAPAWGDPYSPCLERDVYHLHYRPTTP